MKIYIITVYGGLYEDAWEQVLDNKAFATKDYAKARLAKFIADNGNMALRENGESCWFKDYDLVEYDDARGATIVELELVGPYSQ